jgi:TRAP-type C4-dicarboxylate transport system permease small subunit
LASGPTIYSTSWTRGPSAGWLTVPLDLFAAFLLTIMVLLTVADVVGREGFNTPVFAAVEITTILMPFLIFAVLPYVTYQEQHITVGSSQL